MAFGRRRRSVLVDALAGMVSGLAGSWAMEKARDRIARAGGEETKRREQRAQEDAAPPTVLAAERAADAAGASIPEHRLGTAARAVHYATGAAFGALYGVVAPRLGAPALLAGPLYGAAVWLLGDEALVPALGLSKEPWKYPASTHAKALATHVVYGAATGAGFRLLEAAVR
jgi:uncharacterized membrane protein YagU involved in acid resistance